MARLAVRKTVDPQPSVEEVAAMIRRMNRRDQRRLLQLVPELNSIEVRDRAASAVEPVAEADDLAMYIRELRAQYADAEPLDEDAPFLGGLTVGEFFALPDEEQERLWDEAHVEVEKELRYRELSARPDAVPAGQKRRSLRDK
jgi:hypothetical protein